MNNNEKRFDIIIWAISLFICVLCAWVVNGSFNELNTGGVPLYDRTAFKLLGTLWPITVIMITSSAFLAIKFIRRGLAIIITIIVMMIIQSILLVIILVNGYTLVDLKTLIELESAEFNFLYHVLELSEVAAILFLIFLGVAVWIGEKIRLRIMVKHAGREITSSGIVESGSVVNRLINFFKRKNN